MAPYAGRVRHGTFRFRGREHELPLRMPPHAIHGTTLDRPWQDEGDGTLSIDLGPDWPFPGRSVQRFALDPAGLDVELSVHAIDAPFPASLGLHPWWARKLDRGGPLELDFEARRMWARDDEGISTGELVAPPPRPWDDCFSDLVSPPRLRWPGALTLELTSDTDHWVVYDEPEDAICVEPMTGPPDALNIAPRIVEPGDPLVLRARFAWTLA
jgi:aldose 1-epimerase